MKRPLLPTGEGDHRHASELRVQSGSRSAMGDPGHEQRCPAAQVNSAGSRPHSANWNEYRSASFSRTRRRVGLPARVLTLLPLVHFTSWAISLP